MKLILNHPDHPGYWAVDGQGAWKIKRTRVRLRGENRYTIIKEQTRLKETQRHVINEMWLLRFLDRFCIVTGTRSVKLCEWSEDGNHREMLDYFPNKRALLARAA